MIQLTFQPAFDPFHTVFRLYRLRDVIKRAGPLHRDQVRILDFYLLFPFRISEITLKSAHRRYKKLAEKYLLLKPYGDLPDSNILFDRMKPIEGAAMDAMASRHIFDADALRTGIVSDTGEPTPPGLVDRIEMVNSEQADLIDFLGVLASEYRFLGNDGLKARTGLIEYRYDPV